MATATAPNQQTAIGWRIWLPSTVMMTCSLLSYIDRQTLAVLSPTIIEQTSLTDASYTDAVAVFSIMYMIGNLVWGALLDHLGLRIGMLLGVGLWTVASASHAGMYGFLGFAISRGLLGFGEGAAFPGAMRAAVTALPASKVGRGIGLGYSGASLGGLITPLLVIPFAAIFGWRTAFLVTGALGIIWLAIWNTIAKPPLVPDHRRPAKIRLPNLADRRAWIIISSFGFGGIALAIVAYMAPLYLSRALGTPQADLKLLWIPQIGWEAGYFFWGWVADRFVKFDTGRRPLWVFALLSVLALPSALVPFTSSLYVVLALLTWATFVADGFVVLSLRVGAHLYPPDEVGTAGGIGSASWSAVAAVATPIYGRLLEAQAFTAIWVSMALLPAFGLLLWMWLSSPQKYWQRRESSIGPNAE